MLRLKKPDGIAIKSALVAVSGNSADEDAVRFAAQLTEPLRGNLYIVHVIEVERSLPVDSELPFHTTRGDDLLDRMERLQDRSNARSTRSCFRHAWPDTPSSTKPQRGKWTQWLSECVQDQVRQIRAGRRCAVCARTRALSCRSVAGCGTGRNESRLDGIKPHESERSRTWY